MMDHFREEVVVKHHRILEEIMYYISAVLMVFTALLAVMEINVVIQTIAMGEFEFMGVIFFLINGGVAVLLFLYRDRLRTEYEYTFTNGSLDFAQVFNNKKRKSLGSLKVNNVDAFGKVNSGSFHRYSTMQNVKISNWFLNREADLHYFFFQKDGAKRLIVFEPSPEMVSDLSNYLPFGAKQEN